MAIEIQNILGLTEIGYLYPKGGFTAAEKSKTRSTGRNTAVVENLGRSTPLANTDLREVAVSLQEPSNGWIIAENQCALPQFKPLIEAGYLPVVPQTQESTDPRYNDTVYLWKQGSEITGNEFTETRFHNDPKEPQEPLPAVFAISPHDIGRDAVEVTDDEKRLGNDCRQGWSAELNHVLDSHSQGRDGGSFVLRKVDQVIQTARHEHTAHVMAHNYLAVISDMKDRDVFPEAWDYKKRVQAWEQTRTAQTCTRSQKEKIPNRVNGKYPTVSTTLTPFSSNRSLEVSAIQMASQVGLEADKIPKKIIKTYIKLRNNQLSQTQPTPDPIQNDEQIFAHTLERCGMHNKGKEFMKLYPNIFTPNGKKPLTAASQSVRKQDTEKPKAVHQPTNVEDSLDARFALLLKAAHEFGTDKRYSQETRDGIIDAYVEQARLIIKESL